MLLESIFTNHFYLNAWMQCIFTKFGRICLCFYLSDMQSLGCAVLCSVHFDSARIALAGVCVCVRFFLLSLDTTSYLQKANIIIIIIQISIFFASLYFHLSNLVVSMRTQSLYFHCVHINIMKFVFFPSMWVCQFCFFMQRNSRLFLSCLSSFVLFGFPSGFFSFKLCPICYVTIFVSQLSLLLQYFLSDFIYYFLFCFFFLFFSKQKLGSLCFVWAIEFCGGIYLMFHKRRIVMSQLI